MQPHVDERMNPKLSCYCLIGKRFKNGASKNFSKEELILLLKKGTGPGWQDNEIHKINFKIRLSLNYLCFLQSSKIRRKKCVSRALFSLNIVLRKEKYLTSRKKLIGSLRVKSTTHLRSMKDFPVVNHLLLLLINVIMLVIQKIFLQVKGIWISKQQKIKLMILKV